MAKESAQGTRDRIVQAAKELLDEATDIDNITVRDIAQRADVGTGLVNYHFGSKDALLGIAIGDTMTHVIEKAAQAGRPSESPREHLKNMLEELCDIAMENRKLMQFVLTQSVTGGDTDTPLRLVPFLRNLFGEYADERKLRVIALQIIHPLQVAALSPEAFKAYSGFDLEDAESRRRYLALLVDNLTAPAKEAVR
ncbi:TetR/AcrR family transcriptional regulator [Gordonibacter sp. 28C]|uniref:TetR/AcrR family transcriptional regulator n=1 Tax=Gordonibacter sp. 28C TaxID=2078569 RepID=UPI000DF804BC|nr:TetR/AcrR family transcriptional regulator [Gordonibacter sp. 28C]RDB63835.1 TetR/AcrR family transcriptional regulator [Gordonibacter sp. 28C]